MMVISSTEFQQNVGHYMALVEDGEELYIERKKPTKATFKLEKKQKKDYTKMVRKKSELLKELEKFMFHGGNKESALDFQKRVRS